MNIVETIAAQLREASETKITIPPIRDILGHDAIDQAYEIQSINIEKRMHPGVRVAGRKIGLTSKAVQKQLGVDQPDFGVLLSTMQVYPDSELSYGELIQGKVESEIAFAIGKDITDPDLSEQKLLDAIEFAVPAIEIVGSRIDNWDIKIVDTIADNASASHYVVGHRPTRLCDFDMINCKMTMTNKGKIVSTGKGKDCLGSPLNAALWLAKTLINRGNPIKAGEFLLTGALGPMVTVKPGDQYTTHIEGLGYVSVAFSNLYKI